MKETITKLQNHYIVMLMFLCISVGFSQSAGFNTTFVVLSINGGGNTFYDLQASTGNPDFNGANLGSFCQGSTNGLIFKGAEHNNYKCNGCDITSTRLFYRIYPTATPSGSFVNNNIGFTSDFANGCSGRDQKWSSTSYNTNLLAGLPGGNYTLEVYSEQSTSCSGLQYASNSGANYKATFTVNPSPTMGTVSATPACDGGTSTVSMTGFLPSTTGTLNCTISHPSFGTVPFQRTSTSDASGNFSFQTDPLPLSLNGAIVTIHSGFVVATGCSASFSGKTVTVIVNAIPSPPTAPSPQNFLSTNYPAVSNLSASGTNLKWYTSATGGSPLLNNTQLSARTYYVSQTSNSCESSRTAVNVSFGNGDHLFFDGVNDHIIANVPNLPQGNNPRTLEVWMKSNYQYNGQYKSILNYGNSTPNSRFAIMLSSGNVYFAGEFNDLSTSVYVLNNQWHKLTVTYDGSLLKIYIDGVLTASANKNLNTLGTNLVFGKRSWANDEFYYGHMDEVKVWNRALTQDEINLNCIVTNGLIARFNFNQGIANGTNTSVTTLTESINNNNGTLTNFALTENISNWASGSPIVEGPNAITLYADNDADGFGNPLVSIISCNPQSGYVTNNTDCNDNQIQYSDADGDGFGSLTQVACGVPNNTDCDDAQTFYTDLDNDGFGTLPKLACGTVTNNTDCNDAQTYYTDGDNDGFGTLPKLACGTVTNNTDCDDTKILHLDADGDGYGSTTHVACGGVELSGDCVDINPLINPGVAEICYDGIDNDCDGTIDDGCTPIVSVIQSTQCGETLPAINSYIYANLVSGAQGYRFRVTDLTTNQVQTIDKALRVFTLTQLPNYAFDRAYQIEVAIRYNNVWQPTYGEACFVTTPATTTQIQSSQCSATLTTMNDVIFANNVPFATGYRFRITDVVSSAQSVIDRPIRDIRLTNLLSPQFNTTYSIEVAVRNTNGTYLPYGTVCNVTSPSFPTTQVQNSQCDLATTLPLTTTLFADSFSGATMYRFKFVSGATTIQVDRPIRSIYLASVPGIQSGTAYSVSVALQVNGTFGPFGKVCLVTTAGGARETEVVKAVSSFNAVAYPNPYLDNFKLNVTTSLDTSIQVRVYDMLGKQVENRTVDTAVINEVEIGENYPAGVYNVIVTQGSDVKTLRVIKR